MRCRTSSREEEAGPQVMVEIYEDRERNTKIAKRKK